MGPRVLVVDNYDSFVYNLVQELGELGAEPVVFRNDAIDVDGIRAERPDAVLISPGPGRPEDGGVSLEVVRQLGGEIPLLGVCLGHQCIGQAFGGEIVAAPHLMHGKTSEIHHDGQGIFAGLPNPFVATRYHSLVVRPESVPAELEVTATSTDGVVMGLRHRTLRIEGVQFHPESVLTASGPALLAQLLGPAGRSGGRGRLTSRRPAARSVLSPGLSLRRRPPLARAASALESPWSTSSSSWWIEERRRRRVGLADRDVDGAAAGHLGVAGRVLTVDVARLGVVGAAPCRTSCWPRGRRW